VKHCNKCNTLKQTTEFYKNKTKSNGLDSSCKLCSTKRYEAWRQQNYQKALVFNRASAEKWRKEKPHKNAAKAREYVVKKTNAQPVWLTASQKLHIDCKYSVAAMLSKNTEEQYHVDHIVPLKGKTVCGLHVPWNLQVIPAQENLRKSNRI
jgi:hypothetical protein